MTTKVTGRSDNQVTVILIEVSYKGNTNKNTIKDHCSSLPIFLVRDIRGTGKTVHEQKGNISLSSGRAPRISSVDDVLSGSGGNRRPYSVSI